MSHEPTTSTPDRITVQAQWLSEQIDDDEHAITDVLRMESHSDVLDKLGRAIHQTILDADSPNEAIRLRVNECASKRGIIAWVLKQAGTPELVDTVGVVLDWLTLPYTEREGFRDEWRPRWLGPDAPPSVWSPLFEHIPAPVFRAVEVGVQLVSAPKGLAGLSWGDVDAMAVLFWRKGEDGITVGCHQLMPPDKEGAHSGPQALRDATGLREAIVHPAGLPFYGLGMIAEKLQVDADVDLSALRQGTPQQLAEACRELVHSGRARRSMVIAAAFTDGWRFECVWPETGGDQRATVLAPDEDWPEPHELALAVTEAVERLSATGVTPEQAEPPRS